MSFQGQEFTAGMRSMVVNLKKYFDTEQKKQGQKYPWSIEQVALSLGIGTASVRRILAEYNRSGKMIVPLPTKPKGRPECVVSDDFMAPTRAFIRSKNKNGAYVSLENVASFIGELCKNDFNTTTIWRTLNRWGFTYGLGKRHSALKEKDYVILARRSYLRKKMLNRQADGCITRPEVYLDETFVNKNHSNQFTWYFEEDGPEVNKPSGKGERLIIVSAITANGWVPNATLIFEANRRTGDYHGQMNWENFSRWFVDQLIPNIPSNSLIIMDNASYHNTLEDGHYPTSTATKDELRKYLDVVGIPWGADMLKPELYALCKHNRPEKRRKLDEIASSFGHAVLRTPQYHPELQPIETCWGVVKNHIARNCDFTLKKFRENLPLAMLKVTEKTCQGLIKKVAMQEEKFWVEDGEIDEHQNVDEIQLQV